MTMFISLEWHLFDMQLQSSYSVNKSYMAMNCLDGRRLGNLMFNYASLLGISKNRSAFPILSVKFPLYTVFNLTVPRSTNLRSLLGTHRDFKEKHPCKYDVDIEHLSSAVSYSLNGYYQSFKYFEMNSDAIRQEFQFKYELLQKVDNFFRSIGDVRNKTIIGIHVRRGDIIEPYYVKYGYVTPDADYFQMARNFFKARFQNALFIVCSDSKKWSREHIQGDDVIHSQEAPGIVDMAILSKCNHTIMSLGSYGWWAAWLANGTTVYYSGWPRPDSELDDTFEKKDYFLPDWIPMP